MKISFFVKLTNKKMLEEEEVKSFKKQKKSSS